MTDLDDLIARLRMTVSPLGKEAAAALEALRDEVARLQLEVHMAKSVALKMEAIIEQHSRAAPVDETPKNIPVAGSWGDGDTVWSIKENKVTHLFEGGRWVSQE